MATDHWSRDLFRDDPLVAAFTGWDDPDADYSFDVADIVQTERGWFLVSDSGCSCYGPGDNPTIDWGPGGLDDLRAWVDAEYGNTLVTSYYSKKHAALVAAIGEAAA